MNAIKTTRTFAIVLVILGVGIAWASAPTCTHCKVVFPDTYKYCPFCGNALNMASDTTDAGLADSNQANPSGESPSNRDSVTNSIGMKLKLIQPGSFTMGSEEGYDNEVPAHKVTLTRPFYIGIYEVTQQQYEKIMGVNPSHFTGANRPVDTVTWENAVAFCNKLSDKEGRRYRLPTEAEWEYACRAGAASDYYWGEDFDGRFAWIDQNSKNATHDTGTRLPNAWGLYDMSGNVSEWCSDWYDNYAADPVPQTDPSGPSRSDTRVIRGGSWNQNLKYCRSCDREDYMPDQARRNYGFRVVLDPTTPKPD